MLLTGKVQGRNRRDEKMRRIPLLILAVSALSLQACAGRHATGRIDTERTAGPRPGKAVTNPGMVKKLLENQYTSWKGVRYRKGGMSKRGVDCSGFVHVTYRDRLGVDIVRSTKQLSSAGRAVRKRDLSAGDLVFFKTGVFQRHVGIYLGEGQFLHASTSRGVMKSSLAGPYWSKKYWQSRRVLSY
jgi:lipoprotein Spr/probable lipoprotein NlpC